MNEQMEDRSPLDIHPLLNKRYSPRAFSDKAVTDEELGLLFEAARWASSSHNEQPWRFLVTRLGQEGYDELFASLWDMNQAWANKAPVLILNMVKRNMVFNGEQNFFARHDLGAALAQFTFQATTLGLGLHQLAGLHADHARQAFGIPDDLDVVSALALGHIGEPELLQEPYRSRELKRTPRKPINELVCVGKFSL